ncbi:TRAP transporter small permease [Candidatus Deferrimicrobium sp.]|jgi:TRAP-type C4-dicarboxylate transport system permease small subunit|uniref:TRAP transporter small permease n=1 Tax=Candidatus Deferrimicrobium sp. TaxID=3060586 RepID=UPI002ED77AB5
MGLERLSELLRKGMMIVGGVSLLAITLLATMNVALRIFHVPVSGSYEVVSFLGAIVTAGALGYTQKRKDHIVVDILSDKFPSKVKRVLDRVSYLLILVFFSIVSWQTFVYGKRLMRTGELSETLKIAYYPFVFLVGIGFAVLALTSFLDLIETFWTREERN